MNFNFGEVLTRAWQIIWKNKVLWIFGILASCTRGNGGGGGGGGNTGYQFSSGDGQSPFSNQDFSRIGQQIAEWVSENLWIIIAIIAGLFLVSLFFYFIGFVGKIGLIKGIYQAETGIESLNFGELFSGSLPYFWRVFGLNFLVGLAVLLILLPMVLMGI